MLLDISKKTTQNNKSNYTRVKKSVVNNQKRTQQFRVMADKKKKKLILFIGMLSGP